MLGMLFDAALIGTIIAVMEQEDFPGWFPTVGASLPIGVSTLLTQKLLAPSLGELGMWAGIGVGSAIGGLAISALCGMSYKRAAYAALTFLTIKALIAGVFLAIAR